MEKNILVDDYSKATRSISIIRELLNDDDFKNEQRTSSRFFSRNFKLNFVTVILLILQKSVKSLQLVLNEFFNKLDNGTSVTKSAFTQARRHLKPEAFVILNQKAVIDVFYDNDGFLKVWGFRLLAIDGSKIHLPESPEIKEEFGTINFTNGKDNEVYGQHCYGLASVMYDVQNKIVIDACLAPAKAYEVDLAMEHIKHAQNDDMILFDRNYSSYLFLASLIDLNIQFTGRCSKQSFKAAQRLFKQSLTDSSTVTLFAKGEVKKKCKKLGLPTKITVRFVRVRLSTGEIEVLVTSLLDEKQYTAQMFKELYNLRWGVECGKRRFKGTLKY